MEVQYRYQRANAQTEYNRGDEISPCSMFRARGRNGSDGSSSGEPSMISLEGRQGPEEIEFA